MTASIISGGRELTGQDLSDRARRAAGGLVAMGIGEGDSIALLLRNDLVFFEVHAAAALVGAYVVPINWHFRTDEALHVLRDSGSKLLVAHADLRAVLGEELPQRLPVLWVETPAEIQAAYELAAAPLPGRTWQQWLEEQLPFNGQAASPRMGLIYTSGTTGKPKGVRREPADPDMQARMAKLMGTALGLQPGRVIRTAITGPIYHAAPFTYAVVAAQLGGLVVLQPRFDAEELLSLVERHRLTHLHLVPTMFVRLLKLPELVRSRYDLSSLTFVAHGAAPCPPHVKRAMIEWWGPVIHEYYGGTETGGAVCHGSEESLAKPGTIGRAMEGCSIRILAPDGRICTAGEVGEVYIRTQSFPDFTYHGRDEDRRAIAAADGYVTIGDVGYLDADGYLFLCDRARDMVISGGVNIYPAEIEATLLDLEGVRDCAVFGVPDEEFGEALCAVIEAESGAGLTEDQVRDHVQQRLAGYKVPKLVRFDDNLPREDSGKIFKRRLRDAYWAGSGRTI
jgi:long-chain acyl-CoA synthetase